MNLDHINFLSLLVRIAVNILNFFIFFILGMECAKLDVQLTTGKSRKIKILFHLVTWPTLILVNWFYQHQLYRILDYFFPLA